MLAPLTADQILLLSRMSNEHIEVLQLLVRRVNGIANPRYSIRPTNGGGGEAFDRFIDLYVLLREAGKLDIVGSADHRYQMLIHDYGESENPTVDGFA